MREDDLDPARGIIHSVLTAAAIWLVIGAVLWLVWG